MTLTLGGGPLASRPPETTNYAIDGPAHRLFWHPFPRRVRAVFGDTVVLDSSRAALLHESNLLPQLYVPREDMRLDLLEPTEHTTHCPFKGDATYESIRLGERVAENAVWTYGTPNEDASWLLGHVGVYWQALDAWFDEDEEVVGHIRDPYHRVDARSTSREVRVSVGGVEVAATRRALLVSETGLPNRFYVPADDVRVEYLVPSATHTVCPYKGRASYRGVRVDGTEVPDAAWSYPEPLEEARRLTGHWCFAHDGVDVRVDGVAVG